MVSTDQMLVPLHVVPVHTEHSVYYWHISRMKTMNMMPGMTRDFNYCQRGIWGMSPFNSSEQESTSEQSRGGSWKANGNTQQHGQDSCGPGVPEGGQGAEPERSDHFSRWQVGWGKWTPGPADATTCSHLTFTLHKVCAQDQCLRLEQHQHNRQHFHPWQPPHPSSWDACPHFIMCDLISNRAVKAGLCPYLCQSFAFYF